MKNNTIFLLFIFSLGIVFYHNTYAQTDTEYRTVTGQVVDKDNEPVAHAKVITISAKNVVETGENGEFTVEISGEEADFLRVVKKGYESQSMFVQILKLLLFYKKLLTYMGLMILRFHI